MPLTISSIIFCSALMLTIQPKEKVEWQAKEREGHIWTIHGNGIGSFYFPIKAVSLSAICCFPMATACAQSGNIMEDKTNDVYKL